MSIVRDPARRDEPEVVSVIRQDVRSDYVAVAAHPDLRGTDVVLVEHEYGIFGGEAGAFVLSLVEELAQPLVVTLHTVLSEPSVRQARCCARCVTAPRSSRCSPRPPGGWSSTPGVAPPERVRVIPHGAPQLSWCAGPPASPGPRWSGWRAVRCCRPSG